MYVGELPYLVIVFVYVEGAPRSAPSHRRAAVTDPHPGVLRGVQDSGVRAGFGDARLPLSARRGSRAKTARTSHAGGAVVPCQGTEPLRGIEHPRSPTSRQTGT